MLSAQLKKTLKTKAHSLKPVVMLGAKGLTEAVISEIDLALNVHELIKIKLAGIERAERKEIIDQIMEQTDAELIQTIGAVAVIYKENPDK